MGMNVEAATTNPYWVFLAFFLVMMAEAVLVWWLAGRAHVVHATFLHGQLDAKDRLIESLTDKVQAPTAQARVEMAKAKVEEKTAEALTVEDIQRREAKNAEQEFFQDEKWMLHEDFRLHPQKFATPNEDGSMMVIVDYSTEPATMTPVLRGEFYMRYGS